MGFNDYNYGNDDFDGIAADFNDDQTRKNFTKKVLALVGLQLTMTFGATIGVSVVYESNPQLLDTSALFSPGALWFSIAMTFVILFGGMCCCAPVLRKTPHNLIFLFLFTLFESHVVSTVGLKYDIEAVGSAMGATAGVVLIVSCLVWFTNFDFSKLLPIMGAVLMVWILVIIISRIFGIAWDRTAFAAIGATIFTIFLAVDLKMIMGNGKFTYGEDDYVFAAINVYLDILNIFLYILQFMNND